MTAETHRQRLQRVREQLAEKRLHAFIVFNRASIRYLTGFTGSAGVLVIGRDSEALLVTDGRYQLQAKEQTKGTGVKVTITRRYHRSVAEWLKRQRWRQVGFESRYCTVAFLEAMREHLKGTAVRLVGVNEVVEPLRAIKEVWEVERIREAAKMADTAFEHALKVLREGMTEKELAWEIEAFLRTHGAEAMAFPPIVVAGERSALPHGQPSDRPIRKGDLVTFDLGAVVNGYCSDLTRTIFVGRPTAEQRRIYRAVWEAQRRGMEALRSGVKARQVHRIVRDALKAHGLERFFTHGTGHGVGLEVHEMPAIGQHSRDVLQAGMVVTMEPGVYLPKVGGVRIEDLLWLTEKGAELLSHALNPPKLLSV